MRSLSAKKGVGVFASDIRFNNEETKRNVAESEHDNGRVVGVPEHRVLEGQKALIVFNNFLYFLIVLIF